MFGTLVFVAVFYLIPALLLAFLIGLAEGEGVLRERPGLVAVATIGWPVFILFALLVAMPLSFGAWLRDREARRNKSTPISTGTRKA